MWPCVVRSFDADGLPSVVRWGDAGGDSPAPNARGAASSSRGWGWGSAWLRDPPHGMDPDPELLARLSTGFFSVLESSRFPACVFSPDSNCVSFTKQQLWAPGKRRKIRERKEAHRSAPLQRTPPPHLSPLKKKKKQPLRLVLFCSLVAGVIIKAILVLKRKKKRQIKDV